MDVFETIGEIKSPREVAEEWRGIESHLNVPSGVPGDRDVPPAAADDFEERVRNVISCHEQVTWHIAHGDRHATTTAGQALGAALQQIAAVDAKLERLLGLRGHPALLFLEALQTVRGIT
jgi:hypothetical protein